MKLDKYIAVGMLLFAIIFNLWLYRLEPTAKVDPNDNAFQFALVDRTNQIWDYASRTCPSFFVSRITCHASLLIDHWVPNWAQGYNLPFYYSHLPQIAIVASYRFFSLFTSHVSLFTYYHWIIYLLISLFPLSIFLALRVTGLPWLSVGIGSLLASQISTDGLYGLDPPSFLWRGWGLSSQLFAMIFMPLALAYSYKYLAKSTNNQAPNSKRYTFFSSWLMARGSWHSLFPAVLFLFLTTEGHLGMGMITLLSLPILAYTSVLMRLLNHEPLQAIMNIFRTQTIRLVLLFSITLFFLSYWIIPIVLNNNYHNVSFWDPIWKFDSYGWKDVLKNLFNGDLFDFGRTQLMTISILLGIIYLLTTYNLQLTTFVLLFFFYLLLYFGRTTWGGLIDLIPSMKEFHISRFLVGVHLSGLFLAPIGFGWIAEKVTAFIQTLCGRRTLWISQLNEQNVGLFNSKKEVYLRTEDVRNSKDFDKTRKTKSEPKQMRSSPLLTRSFIRLFVYSFISLLALPPIYKQTIKYNELNETLIRQANTNYNRVSQDLDELFTTLRARPSARIFAGRGGGWGKDFLVAETPYYMHLSTFGLPVTMWLPETWSNNSDTEQYFSENLQKDYDLYNMRYVVSPPSVQPQEFWKLIKETNTWKLYEVLTSGYFTPAVRPAIVATDKLSFINVVRLWIQSDYSKNGLYPEITFTKDYPRNTGLPNFRMLNEVTYQVPDGSSHNLFAEPPVYMSPNTSNLTNLSNLPNTPTILSQDSNNDMIFKANVKVEKDCTECILVLKQTYHPNWKATVNGEPVKTFSVFPFFTAISLTKEGIYDITFSYQPSKLKITLLNVEIILLVLFIVLLSTSAKTHKTHLLQ